MTKTGITFIVIAFILIALAWYLGFLDFIGVKGGSCNDGSGNFLYGKCNSLGSGARIQQDLNCVNGCDQNRVGYDCEGNANAICGNQTIIIVEQPQTPSNPPPRPQSPTAICDTELAEAQKQFSDSKKVCIQLAVSMRCPKDNQVRTTNPCVANILEGKGWTKVTE